MRFIKISTVLPLLLGTWNKWLRPLLFYEPFFMNIKNDSITKNDLRKLKYPLLANRSQKVQDDISVEDEGTSLTEKFSYPKLMKLANLNGL